MFKRIKEFKIHIAIIFFLAGLFFGINISGEISAAEEPSFKYLDYFHQVYQLIKTSFVEVPDNKNVFYGAIRGAIASLNDPYSRFLDEEAYSMLKEETTGQFVGIGVEITIRDGEIVVISPIEDTPAMRAGIKSGDVIIRVDDTVIKEKDLSDTIKMIKGTPHTNVKITVRRAGYSDPLEFTVERVPIKVDSVAYGVLKEDESVGYLKIKVFSAETPKDVEEALKSFEKKKIDKLIVDLRWNPGGLLDRSIKITEYFLEKGQTIVSTRGRAGNENYSEFKSEMPQLYKGKLIVLVNNGSASASEIFSGAVRDNNRGKLLGTKTFGKGSVQKFFNLDDNVGVTLTIAKYYTPSGVSIHGKGIVPDYIVNNDEISKEESDKVQIIYKDKLIDNFVKAHGAYSDETRKAFRALLKERNLSLTDKNADYILKREINKFAKSSLYDLEFDNQLVEAVRIINAAEKKG